MMVESVFTALLRLNEDALDETRVSFRNEALGPQTTETILELKQGGRVGN